MAKVLYDNIIEMSVKIIQEERKYDSKDLPEILVKKYLEKGYEKCPTTYEGAKEVGDINYNGLKVSLLSSEYSSGKLDMILQPTRFLIGQAMRDLYKESPELMEKVTPLNIVNVSVLTPVMYNNECVLIGHVRANSTGIGQIQIPLAGGGVEADSLGSINCLWDSLKREVEEEIGLDAAIFKLYPEHLFIEEKEVGNCNICSITEGLKIETILEKWLDLIKGKEERDIEAPALAVIPLQNIERVYEDVEILYPNENFDGVISKREKRVFRPLSKAILDWIIKDEKNKEKLIKAC